MNYEDKINLLKNQTYYYLFFNNKLINTIATKYPILEVLVSHEYHQDPEWLDLKEPNGERMSEEYYLKNILFKDIWTKEMKEGLVQDIEEIEKLPANEILRILNLMGIQFAFSEESVKDWLEYIKNLAINTR